MNQDNKIYTINNEDFIYRDYGNFAVFYDADNNDMCYLDENSREFLKYIENNNISNAIKQAKNQYEERFHEQIEKDFSKFIFELINSKILLEKK